MASVGSERIRLGDLLVERQIISPNQLDEALARQKSSGLRLGRQLLEMKFIDESTLLDVLSRQLGIRFIDLRHFDFEPGVVTLLPERLARRYRVIALRDHEDHVLVGMADPTDIFCLDELQKVISKRIEPAVVRESELLDILNIAYSRSDEIASLAEELDEELSEGLGFAEIDLSDIISDEAEGDAPVVRLLQKIFEEALQTRASDIHIEPDEDVLRIRKRIDGTLVEQIMNEKRIAAALVVRLKLMAGLNISEKRLPQDGRFNLRLRHRSVDIRLSTMPVQHGESIVMRLLDQSQGILKLEQLGMSATEVARVRELIYQPHGLVLVTGPTGSGKTTTLYSALSELNRSETKIITVEDPVEYRLPRINQVQIHEKIGLSFAAVLKASLRQDPDILLVGEIRDRESAEIALRAALTGHLVLSTLHTNDAVSSALRLVDMGVDAYLVASSLSAIIAQRLIRKVCENCAEPYELTDHHRAKLQALHLHVPECREGEMFRQGRGCVHCFGSGYRGRLGIYEMLQVDADMSNALRKNDVAAFNRAALSQAGFRPLGVAVLDVAARGISTYDEVLRICGEVSTIANHALQPAAL
jgi:MSHA biogenesis protein MshE